MYEGGMVFSTDHENDNKSENINLEADIKLYKVTTEKLQQKSQVNLYV